MTTGLIYAPKVAYPFYNATKAALHSFTQVIRTQMAATELKVVEVMFPAVDTPWHEGRPPRIAIGVEQAVDEMLRGLEKNREEIHVGKAGLIHWVARIAPKFAMKKIKNLPSYLDTEVLMG